MCNWLKVATVLTFLASAVPAPADIFRWDNGQLIPGTEGITPGPGVQLDHRELAYAMLVGLDLPSSRFDFSNLSYARLTRSDLRSANLSGAVVTGASLSDTTFRGFTKEQLYSTASYQMKDMSGIGLGENDLRGWDFGGQNLGNASLRDSTLTNANLSAANLSNAFLDYTTLTNADFSGAVVTGANLSATTSSGFTQEQLYSTASYVAKNLTGIKLESNNLSGWDFSNQNLAESELDGSMLTSANLSEANLANAGLNGTTLTNADLSGANLFHAGFYYSILLSANLSGANLANASLESSTLTNANLTGANLANADLYSSTLANADVSGAVVTGTSFRATTLRGFSREQLYSTASFQTKNLSGIELGDNDLSGWDFSGQNLVDALLYSSTLTSANLGAANLANANLLFSTLTNANLSGAVVTGTTLSYTTSRGFTKEQLYSTASYQAKDMSGIGLEWNDLSGWNFGGQNLANANLRSSKLTNANLSGANLANAKMQDANLNNADLANSTLTNADLNGAVVSGVNLTDTTSRGFTKEQLYSTLSYRVKSLVAIHLALNNLSDWDFSGQNLANSVMQESTLLNANLGGANLANANLFSSTLTNASMSGAVVTGTDFGFTTSRGFTKDQLYSTASYQAKNLPGILLGYNDLIGWDFNGQNLANAVLYSSTLTDATMTGAVVTGANFDFTTSRGFTKEQLYSTASYQAKNLTGIMLQHNDLGGWDFSDQNLANAILFSSVLTNTNLSRAVVTGANFGATTSRGFTKEQLYSTASYHSKNLTGIKLRGNDLNGWDFSGQNLANADLHSSTLTNANFTGADTRGAQYVDLAGATSLNAILREGTIAGLELAGDDQLIVRNYLGNPQLGLGPIPVTIQDKMALADGGVLQLLFDAYPWHSTISFQPDISVTLGGSLELAFADSVAVAKQVGRTIDIFNWTGVAPSGEFVVDSAFQWDLSSLYTSGEVTLISALAGDTDGDGQVGLSDLNNVRNNFGAAGQRGLLGDAIPFDGIVDLADLNSVRNNFGASVTQVVPEPSAILLLVFGLLSFVLSSVRRRCRRLTSRAFAMGDPFARGQLISGVGTCEGSANCGFSN